MNQNNIAQSLQLATLIAPAAVTATANQTGVDISTYVGELAVILTSAAGTGTTPTLDVKLQESDAVGGTYTDISGAAFTQVTTAASVQKINVQVDGLKQFVRVVDTVSGTSPSFTRGVALVGLKQNR